MLKAFAVVLGSKRNYTSIAAIVGLFATATLTFAQDKGKALLDSPYATAGLPKNPTSKGIIMNTKSLKALSLLAAIVFGFSMGNAVAEKSGKFNIHSGWKSVGEINTVAENRLLGHGMFYGVTFNEEGKGPLHVGTATCNYILDLNQGAGPGKGTCAWSDADGDKIFTDYSGNLATSGAFEGLNQITGGTGKYNGAKGKVPFQCKMLSASGHVGCTQQFEYQVP